MDKYSDPDRPLHYTYSSINKSLIDKYLLRHWWAIAFKALPEGVPANLVSIVGNVGSWTAFALLVTAGINPAARHNPWLFIVAAICVAFYHTLDAIDGMQARRAGASGPLGEFVDHWFDSFNTFILPLGFVIAFPVLPPVLAVLFIYLFLASDLLTLEAVRRTGVLVFDSFGIDEGVFLNILLMLAVGILGYDFWATPLALGISPIQITFAASSLPLLVFFVKCVAKTGGLDRAAVEALFLMPIATWTVLAQKSGATGAVLCGGLLLGFTASRFSGDLLRERLLGLEYKYVPFDLPFLGLALLASVLMPGVNPKAIGEIGWIALTWTLCTLGYQFLAALFRVEEVLGIGLFGPIEIDSRAYAISSRIRQNWATAGEAIQDLIDRSHPQ